jgi:ribulose-phosphate 3-epimerase
VREPKEAIGAFLHAGAGKLVIHLESTSDVTGVIDELEERYGRDKEFSPELLSVALSINIDTDLALLEPHLPRIDYVQFMGIARIGQQGIPFDERVLEKIATFKKAHPDIPVQVDGGVSLETAPKLLAAGAERLVVGSALWKSDDVAHTLHAFNELLLEYGRYN